MTKFVLTPLRDRFWSKVNERGPDDCWEWTAALNGMGYGVIGIGRSKDGIERAHRLSYCWANGLTIAELGELFVLHHCDNRSCVNPRHLYLGTAKQNTRDMLDRGRHRTRRGSANPFAKLTEWQVQRIRQEHNPVRGYGRGYRALAKKYGVNRTTISRIVRWQKWHHLP